MTKRFGKDSPMLFCNTSNKANKIVSTMIVGMLLACRVFTTGVRADEALGPATQPTTLPELNPAIRAQFQMMKAARGTSQTWDNVGAQWGKLMAIRSEQNLTNEQWIKQLFLLTLPENEPDPTGAWAVGISLVSMNRAFANNVTPDDYLAALGDYAESDDKTVSSRAMEMIIDSHALLPLPDRERLGIVFVPSRFESIETYLEKTGGTPASHAKLIRKAFTIHNQGALWTTSKAYLDKKSASVAQAEVASFIASKILLEVAANQDKPALRGKALTLLERMSRSPHWCVRAYAARALSDYEWQSENDLRERLAKDENPIVSQLCRRAY